MKRALVRILILVLFSICPIGADEISLQGSWSVSVYIEVSNSIVLSPEIAQDYILNRTFVLDVFDEGVAYVVDDGSSTEVGWERYGNVFTIWYPDDGDFQYVEYYHVTKIDDWTMIAVIYASISNPVVAIMNLVGMVGMVGR